MCEASTMFLWNFMIIDRIGLVDYRLAPSLIVKVHEIFHVSFLKNYVKDANHVIYWYVLQVEPNGEFQLEP